jgi:arginase
MTRFFTVPYDSGHYALRMGAGPFRLARELGVEAEEIEPASAFRREITTAFELYRALATRVREANDFPVVLSGNCGSAIGAAAGVGTERLAVLWFDAHGDYNTPDTSDSGFLDGMCLSILTGRAFKSIAATIPGFAPVPASRTIHIGSRDYSPGEREALVADGVRMTPDFDGIDADRILVHVDLDVIDPRFGRANQFAVGGGLSADDVLRVIDQARERFTIAGLVLASYDPSCDPEGSIAAIGARIARHVAA